MSDLVTGEAVPLEMRLAKLPSRALSIMLDLLLLAVVALGLLLLLSQVVPDVDDALAAALIIAGTVFVLVVVPTTIETLTRGKSVGKFALGLRVVRDDGGPIRFRHALVRALAGVFADFIVTAGLGAVVCSLLSSKDKRIGDVLAGTIVVRERIPTTSAVPPTIDPALADWARSLELSRLSDGLAMAARTFLARAPELAPEIRERMASDLAAQFAQVISPPAPPGTPAWVYLSSVLGERRRRDTLRFAEDDPQAQPPRPESSTASSSAPPSPPPPPYPGQGTPPEPPRPEDARTQQPPPRNDAGFLPPQ